MSTDAEQPPQDTPEGAAKDIAIVKDVKSNWRFLKSVWFWVIAGPVNMLIAAAIIWAFPFIFLGFPPVPAGLENAKKAVVIDKLRQAAYTYENGKLKNRFVILTGKGEHDTPVGKFTVTKKDKDYVSKKYNAPMPNSVFFIESHGVAMHASFAVGFKWAGKQLSLHNPYIGSHGCVRMTTWGSMRMFKFADFGTPVWVIDPRTD